MIPSSPRRTLLFLVLSTAVFFIPDLLVSDPWAHQPVYIELSALYQGLVVLAGFAFGPWMGRLMMTAEETQGPVRQAVDAALARLGASHPAEPPVRLFRHPGAFVLTAGLLPSQCEVFLSTGQVIRLGPMGLRFLLARARVHARLSQRLAAVLPVLLLTVLVPDTPTRLSDWITLSAALPAWLVLHWVTELHTDRQAAAMMGPDAGLGLAELLRSESRRWGASLILPARWRLWQMARIA